MSNMRDLLGKITQIDESMKSDAKKPTGPKFPGYWKGTDKANQAKNKMVGGSAEESILHDLEKALVENPKANPHKLMREFQEFKEGNVADSEYTAGARKAAQLAAFYMQSENLRSMFTVDEYIFKKMNIQNTINEGFNSKQDVINYFISNGKTAAQGAAAWERGWRGPQPKAVKTKPQQAQQKYWWQDKEDLNEYGGVGGYGAASQAPAGTTQQNPDPAAQQAKADAQQIQKSTGQIAGQLNQQGAAQSLNKVKFSDTMTKLDAQPNTDLNAQELKQLEPLAVATSKALQNPQTANQMKQLISKSDTVDKQKELKVQQAQQQTGTNAPAGQQTNQPGQQPQQTSAGQTK